MSDYKITKARDSAEFRFREVKNCIDFGFSRSSEGQSVEIVTVGMRKQLVSEISRWSRRSRIDHDLERSSGRTRSHHWWPVFSIFRDGLSPRSLLLTTKFTLTDVINQKSISNTSLANFYQDETPRDNRVYSTTISRWHLSFLVLRPFYFGQFIICV